MTYAEPARITIATEPVAAFRGVPSSSKKQDRPRVLKIVRRYPKPNQRISIGVIAPIRPGIESAEEVRERVLEASEYIPIEQLGTTDDCGLAALSDDPRTSRDTAFAKIRAQILGAALAEKLIGGGSS